MPRPPSHPDRHLWNNNGVWFIHYTVYPTPTTKERVRRSLQTKCREIARVRRDEWLLRMATSGIPLSWSARESVRSGVTKRLGASTQSA